MTLAAVWVDFRSPQSQQLCFASDSRTMPGPIEGVTKVILFGRPDIAAVWAGDYRFASLIVAHLDAFFTSSAAMTNRDIDIAQAFNAAVAPTYAHLARCVAPAIPAFLVNSGAQTPEPTSVIVGGYSIKSSEFWTFRVMWSQDKRNWKITTEPMNIEIATFIGDDRQRARGRAKQARRHRHPVSTGWRMEPLQSIHRAIEEQGATSIGGQLQLAKVYVHGAAEAYGFVDKKTGEVWCRGATTSARGARELAAAGKLIDPSLWLLQKSQYANCHEV